jgi:hypothetical protein
LTTEPTPGPGEPSAAPADKKPADQEAKDEVSAEYEPKIAAARLQIPEDEKLIAAQKEAVVAQTSEARRAAEQQKLKELEDKLENDRKTIDRLVREEQAERDRRRAEAERQKEAARAAQADAERQRKEQAERRATEQQQLKELEAKYGAAGAAAVKEAAERARKEIEEMRAQYQSKLDLARSRVEQDEKDLKAHKEARDGQTSRRAWEAEDQVVKALEEGLSKERADLDALERKIESKADLYMRSAAAELQAKIKDAEKKIEEAEDASSLVTRRKYYKISTGMTYDEVREIMHVNGEEMSRVNLGDGESVLIVWKNRDGGNITVTFYNGRVQSKAQVGLR